MHELSIAVNLVDHVAQAARTAGASRVCAVSVRLGVLSGVVAEALAFAFPFAARGTALADARLDIEEVPVAVFCPQCSTLQTLPEPVPLRCPHCHTPTADIRAGTELELYAIEIEEDAL